MKKRISILALSIIAFAPSAFASGWRIPEQSVNSTALGAAYVANANGADASYYNPANMVFDSEKEKYQFEFAINYIHLTSIEYDDSRTPSLDADSEKENFFIPLFHLVSPEYNNFRFGVSLTTPAGLSKRWENNFGTWSAEEFSLEVVELNPTIAYKLTDWLSIGGGPRAVYSKGLVKSSNSNPAYDPLVISRDLKGDTIDFGYNLAISVKPTDSLTTSVTYRSRVDLDLDSSDATLWVDPAITSAYNGGGAVSVPIPGVLTVATAYTIQSTTIELTWDRTFWSDYEQLDFNYDVDLTTHSIYSAFDLPVDKNFDDSDAFRIGITQKLMDDKLTLMIGFAIDENPVPDETLGFELPDSDGTIYSCGFRYKLNETYEVGMSFLYDKKDSRTIESSDDNDSGIEGEFSNASAYMITTGIMTTF